VVVTLHDKLLRRIAGTGPLTVAEFMTVCLHDPEAGYYATRPRLGPGGDFITAPLISQMFGELIGLWAVETWARLGRPGRFILVELGPGDGALMKDLLRAARIRPEFGAAVEVWLVETSPPLRVAQAERLGGHGPHWASDLQGLPANSPMILIANEFLDCLPARQFVRTPKGWRERVVGAEEGRLVFGLAAVADALIPQRRRDSPIGTVVEVSTRQQNLARQVAERVTAFGGCALFIDYGSSKAAGGDTLQALQDHQKVDVIATAGRADLTVHVDFAEFVDAARAAGGSVTAVRPQGDFLLDLGLEARAGSLIRARPDLEGAVTRQAMRLASPDEMGELFKAVAIHQTGLDVPGFAQDADQGEGLRSLTQGDA